MLPSVHSVVRQAIGDIEGDHAYWKLHKLRGDNNRHNPAGETVALETRHRVGFCHTPS